MNETSGKSSFALLFFNIKYQKLSKYSGEKSLHQVLLKKIANNPDNPAFIQHILAPLLDFFF